MLDRVTVSVIQHRLAAIIAEMGEAMLHTSYSQILNSSRDFSTAICDATGRLVSQADHVPIHIGALPWAVQSVAEFFKGRIKPGDLYLLNDPYHGGNHLPDLTALLPVFADGRLVFWSINRAHHSDMGGATHGTYNAGATEIWQEGLRIAPLKLYDAGELRDDVMYTIATNVRHSGDFLGDLRASMGSARLGERRILGLLNEYGANTVLQAVDEILDSTERQTRACIRSWKDGFYTGEAVLDDDGHGTVDICIRAKVTKRGDTVEVDLRDSDPQVVGFVNSSFPNTMSAVYMAVAYLIDPGIPKNEGAFRPISVKVSQGTIVWPFPPAPVGHCTSHCAGEICEAIIRALAPSCPEQAVAGWSRRFRIAMRGINPRTKQPFIWHMFYARPGGGAWCNGDGLSGGGEIEAGGGIKFGSVEVTENRFPLFLKRHEFRPDSGGSGKFRGGVGSVLEMTVETNAPSVANTAGDGVRHAPYGLFGGQDGSVHRYRVKSGKRVRLLKTKEVGVPVLPGDLFLIESAGGGGYGNPMDRDQDSNAADLRNGFVTKKRPPRKRETPEQTPRARALR